MILSRIALALAVAFSPGCALLGGPSRPPGVPSSYTAADVPAAIATAEEELARGDAWAAFERMRTAKDVGGLPSETRAALQSTLERSAQMRIDQLSVEGTDADALEDVFDMELPRPIAVTAGVRAARIELEDGERMAAYRLIKRIDQRFPLHHERAEAGSIVAEAGFSFANDDGRYGLFFTYRGLAPEVLEYLTLNYLNHPRSDEAFFTLAEHYERGRNWALAIERHQDLALYRPKSPLIAYSKARIPHLRLLGLTSPEYDRKELQLARAELIAWLEAHPLHELEDQVTLDLSDCMRRLADNDLATARFYRRVKNRFGAEYHAKRAIDEALDGLDQEQADEARSLLADIQSSLPENDG